MVEKNYQFFVDSKIKVPSFIGSLTIPDEPKYQKYIDSIKVSDLNREMKTTRRIKTIIKEWLIISIFYTKPFVGNPWFSTSPRDLWFIKYINKIFKNLATFLSETILNAISLLGSHLEYNKRITSFNHFSIDYAIFSYFMEYVWFCGKPLR
ncbi:7122_t:CDS:2, partial [Cetraspora pellucida]